MNARNTTIVSAVFILGTLIYIKSNSPVCLEDTSGKDNPANCDLVRIKITDDISAKVNEIGNGKSTNEEHLRAAFEASEKLYQSYLEKRRQLVGGAPEKINPWTSGRVLYFWDYLLPTFSCPYSTQRIGTFGDGGKWVCGFELFEKEESNKEATSGSLQKSSEPCIIYSFGVASESSFEAEFLNRTDCEIFAYDASVDRPGPQVAANDPRLHFNKMFISDGNNNSSGKTNELTLEQMMKKNNHKRIDFLKMDIEGAEIKVLNQVMDDFEILPFGHLNLEVHGDQEGKLFPAVYKLWERFEEKGLRPFKSEMNHWPCVGMKLRPFLAEYSFINIFGQSRRLP